MTPQVPNSHDIVMSPIRQYLDHLILFVPADPDTQLPQVPSCFSDNFTLTPGGFHADGATSNTLIVLSDGCYIELISFLPTASASLVANHWWGGLYSSHMGWKDWCLTNSLSPAENYNRGKQNYGEPIQGGRKRADEVEVKWSVTFPKGDKGGQDVRGRVPFFCHDGTERAVRVPLDGDKMLHKCGAVGVRELTVLVKDDGLLEGTQKVYQDVLGESGKREGTEVRFSLGRVQEVEGLAVGAEIVLRSPKNEEEKKRVAERGFWYGDVVLCGKASPDGVDKTRERLDKAEGEGDDALKSEMVHVSSPTQREYCERPDARRRQAIRRPSRCWSIRDAVQSRHSTLALATRPATNYSKVTPEGQSATSMSELPQEKWVIEPRSEAIARSPSDRRPQKSNVAAAFPAATTARKQTRHVYTSGPGETASRHRNQTLVSVLKDLSQRVSDDDRRRIEDALQDSDDEVGSPASVSSSSRASAAHQYQQLSRMHSFASSSSHVPQATETSPTSEQSPLPRPDDVIPEESGDEKGTELFQVVEAGFLGQMSEVQWLQSLRSRVQASETVFMAPTETSTSMSHPASPSFPQSPAFISVDPNQQGTLTSYHLDDEGIKLVHGGNPFELPPEHTARLLFQCFSRTVQSSFPIVPATLEGQLHQYYSLKWFALINLVLAIGAKFSHFIHADWRADALDHIVYLSRAYQLLSTNDTVFVLSTPDLSTTQAAGLLAIYYMSVGHFNR
ncbi:hypothetical protein DDE83_000004 [Stemphylium lycopersici]|uniref:Glyoxalase-like domain-containing protein n=1 Tax=Stemphylium lycopersici TaxID=183478 RepID=A0A364NGN1_STELY|nr:hypothetical protein DDE83_000004 [Stemphylium lycopersici]